MPLFRAEKDSFLTLQGVNLPRALVFLCSLAMIGASSYLTLHYYDSHFPKTLLSGSLCDISGFWNCDTATFSSMSNIAGIPISIFGLVVGAIFLIGTFISREDVERSNFFVASLNALGCLSLFLYSLLALGGLCPGCTVYYVSSITVFLCFWVRSSCQAKPSVLVLAGYMLIMAATSGVFAYKTSEEQNQVEEVAKKFLKQFNESANFESFRINSPHRIASATEAFEDADLRITVFSDFQCPVCKLLADMLPKIARRYAGRVNIQYVFYPMDSECNANISRPMHPQACEAAYLASCAGERFEEVHDEIYARQNDLSSLVLQEIANRYELANCFRSAGSKEAVESLIEESDKFGVAATPTMIVNGRKLEGLLPLKFLYVLFDHAIADGNKSK